MRLSPLRRVAWAFSRAPPLLTTTTPSARRCLWRAIAHVMVSKEIHVRRIARAICRLRLVRTGRGWRALGFGTLGSCPILGDAQRAWHRCRLRTRGCSCWRYRRGCACCRGGLRGRRSAWRARLWRRFSVFVLGLDLVGTVVELWRRLHSRKCLRMWNSTRPLVAVGLWVSTSTVERCRRRQGGVVTNLRAFASASQRISSFVWVRDFG